MLDKLQHGIKELSKVFAFTVEKKHPKLPCFVTDDGRVKRIDSNVYSPCPRYKHGYHQITFHIEHTGTQKACLVHRLVWECFVGEIPQGMQINHKDGNKSNNCLSNLELVTPKQNMSHAVETGLKKGLPGQDNSMSKLTDHEYYQVIDRLVKGASNDEISKDYGLHPRYVSLIRHKKRLIRIWEKYADATGVSEAPKSGGLSSKIPLEIRVDVIRQLPSKTNKELARMIDVDCSVISNVRHRKTWKDAWDLFNKRSNDHPERE